MSKEVIKSVDETQDAIEKCLLDGDLSKLSLDQRLSYYKQVCDTVGLNPLTKPFQYIVLNGKLTMYALKGATDQLRRIYDISCEVKNTEKIEDLYVVTVKAINNKNGRVDEDMGFAKISGMKGDMLGNAMLKATTKAKRRVTLSMCGLGMLDEDEVATIPDDKGTGKGKMIFDAPELKGTEKLEATLSEEKPSPSEELSESEKGETSLSILEAAMSKLDEAFAFCETNEIHDRIINNLNDIKYECSTENATVLHKFASTYPANQELFQNVAKKYKNNWKEDMNPEHYQRLYDYMAELNSFFVAEEEVA